MIWKIKSNLKCKNFIENFLNKIFIISECKYQTIVASILAFLPLYISNRNL